MPVPLLIGGMKMPLNIKPCHLRAARDYVGRYHRHSIPPVGGKFAVACYDGDRLCGVAICGRPIARYLNEYGVPYNTLSGEVRAAISDLAVLKYEVLKKVGDAVGNTQAYQL